MASSKELKDLLKEAKDFITSKDFKSALRSCKKILNVDKNNYTALVFCGLCLTEMQQPDQALQVLRSHLMPLLFLDFSKYLGLRKSHSL